MAGQRQKPREALAFRRGGRDRVLEETPAEIREYALPMPEGLTPEAQFVWQETMPLAMRHLVPTDFFHVRRWIFWVNEFVKAAAAVVEEDSVVVQAYGTVLNPRARYLQQCEMNLQRLEASIGLHPQARMRHGITFATEQTALEKLKARRGAGERPKPAPMAFPKTVNA